MEQPTVTEPVSNTFESVLRNHRKGVMLAELSEAMQEAVKATRLHGETATVTLTIKVVPVSGVAVSLLDDIKTKLPKPVKANTLFYTTEDGRLVRDDPSQTHLDLKILKTNEPAEPIKQIVN